MAGILLAAGRMGLSYPNISMFFAISQPQSIEMQIERSFSDSFLAQEKFGQGQALHILALANGFSPRLAKESSCVSLIAFYTDMDSRCYHWSKPQIELDNYTDYTTKSEMPH